MPLVIKADGRREPFDRNKIEHGILAAVAKRPVSRDQVSALALDVEREIGELGVSEIAARDVGERVLPKLRALDQVAYVRFASIYRDFRDLDGFAKELDALRGEDTGDARRRVEAARPTSTRRSRAERVSRRASPRARDDDASWRARSSSPRSIAAAPRRTRSSAA